MDIHMLQHLSCCPFCFPWCWCILVQWPDIRRLIGWPWKSLLQIHMLKGTSCAFLKWMSTFLFIWQPSSPLHWECHAVLLTLALEIHPVLKLSGTAWQWALNGDGLFDVVVVLLPNDACMNSLLKVSLFLCSLPLLPSNPFLQQAEQWFLWLYIRQSHSWTEGVLFSLEVFLGILHYPGIEQEQGILLLTVWLCIVVCCIHKLMMSSM